MKTKNISNKAMLSIISVIIQIGFNRNDAGTLSSYVFKAIQYSDKKQIELGCKMFLDKRTNTPKWGDESGLDNELIAIFLS